MKIPEYPPKDKVPLRLDEILQATRQGLPALHRRRAALEQALEGSRVTRPSFRAALQRPTVAVIAEVKRRSPSAGSIREDLDPGNRAALYAASGAAAISVLTDQRFFGGSMEDLRAAVGQCSLPVLRKDFIVDEVQILEARAAGASAVLLIVRVLGRSRLTALLRCAAELGLDALVEVHTEAELGVALDTNAGIVGINSRDLDTLTIDVERAWALIGRIPSDRVAVAESGIFGQSDVVRAAQAGADAVLIGTALSTAQSPETLLRSELSGVLRRGR
ncbi:MAG TPA: indole-3-glycerol phosphate synthase TrpC [Gemmatimonadales bacterium]|jgi:indole-3-glycerol phosphate synthase|nr:indole-3-glycerol phosphate synthase TrpC [Gemmatimonadales bacterium]